MKYRWFGVGDVNACFALMLDNLVNLTVFASILTVGFGFPSHVVFTRMIPGTTLGVLFGDWVYSIMAIRMGRRLGRDDVTAMPLGLDTPSTLGMALTVLGPAFVAIRGDLTVAGVSAAEASERAALQAWGIGMACVLMIACLKLVFAFAGDWIRRRVPQAGLLGSVGGIGLMLLAFFPMLEIFRAPVVGLVCLGLVVYSLLARIELPWRLPGAAVAVMVGTVVHYILGPLGLLGGVEFQAPILAAELAFPWPTLQGFASMQDALPYMPIALPFGVLTIIGGINVTESARAAGDDYPTGQVLFVDGLATLLAALCGGVAQSTAFIGHPAYKQMGARAGYTLITGLVVGLGGILGLEKFLAAVLPLAAVTPILVFVGFEITVQAFHACPRRHAPAVAFAFLPILSNLLLIRQEATLAAVRQATAGLGDQVAEAVHQVSLGGDARMIAGLGHGFILTSMLWGSFCALVLDRQLLRAAFFASCCGVLTLFGVMHSWSPAGNLYWPWHAPSPMVLHWAAGYFALALVMLCLAPTRGARAPLPVH